MTGSPSLRWLQGWAYRQFHAETPELQHSVGRMDEGGAPAMRQGIATYLGLAGSWKSQQPDALDDDGKYRTPLRAALSRIRDPWLRTFLRDLVPDILTPSVVSAMHGVPKAVESWVMHAALTVLWHEYREQPLAPQRGWISGHSDAQRNAIIAGEAA